MAAWSKLGTDVVVGGVIGAADQLIENQDEKRGLEARAAGTLAPDKKLPIMGRISTYYNYGVPLLALVASLMGWVRDDMETRFVTAGAQLAGRKVTHTMTTGPNSVTPSAAYSAWQRQASAAREAAARAATRTYQPEFTGAVVF